MQKNDKIRLYNQPRKEVRGNGRVEELKPCPFCGGEAVIIKEKCTEILDESAVMCTQCKVQTDWDTMFIGSNVSIEVLQSWNRRQIETKGGNIKNTTNWNDYPQMQPEKDGYYITYCFRHPEKGTRILYFNTSYGKKGNKRRTWITLKGGIDNFGGTHWKPLPEPPE